MQIIKNKTELHQIIRSFKQQNKSIGFVPTMGYLHQGHASLMQLARNQCDIVVVSIFVNPLQFGKNEDFDKYPRDIPNDTVICANNKADILYLPEATDILGPNLTLNTYVNTTQLDQYLCGPKRPDMFKGVCTIITKLFNIISPDKTFFGKKDIQQLRIIERMVLDLDFPIQIIGGETIRDPDGLALSSRNAYLSKTERQLAIIVPQSLQRVKDLINSGVNNAQGIKSQTYKFIQQAVNIHSSIKLDYLEIVDDQSLQVVEQIKKPVIAAIALFIGKTRLIDNIIVSPPQI